MAKRGPKPLPDSIKALKGNPGKRPLTGGEVKATGAPKSPDWLDDYSLMVWAQVMNSMPPKFFTRADTMILAAYCKACSMMRAAAIHIDENGIVLMKTEIVPGDEDKNIEIVTKVTKNPAATILAEQQTKIANLGTRMGLDPAARQALAGAADPAKPKSKFGGLIGTNGSLKK